MAEDIVQSVDSKGTSMENLEAENLKVTLTYFLGLIRNLIFLLGKWDILGVKNIEIVKGYNCGCEK